MKELNNALIRRVVNWLVKLDERLAPKPEPVPAEVIEESNVSKENVFYTIPEETVQELVRQANAILNIVDFPRLCNSPKSVGALLRINQKVALEYCDDDMSYYEVYVLIKGVRVGKLNSHSRGLQLSTGLGIWNLRNRKECLSMPPSVSRLALDLIEGLANLRLQQRLVERQIEQRKQNILSSY